MQEDSLKFAWDTEKLQWDTEKLQWNTNYLKFGYEEQREQMYREGYYPQQQPQVIYMPQQQPTYIPQQAPVQQVYAPQQPSVQTVPAYPTKNDSTLMKVLKIIAIAGVIFILYYACFIYEPAIGQTFIDMLEDVGTTIQNMDWSGLIPPTH